MRYLTTVLCSLLASPQLMARNIAVVDIPEQVVPEGIDIPLQLNGAGIQKNFSSTFTLVRYTCPKRRTTPARLSRLPARNQLA